MMTDTMQPTVDAPPLAQPRGGIRQYPDWTPEQMSILHQIKDHYVEGTTTGKKQVSWASAWRDHPDWKGILLEGDRPKAHLWYISNQLTQGIVPINAVQVKLEASRAYHREHYHKMKKRKQAAERYQRIKAEKLQRMQPAKPHHMSKEGRALRAARQEAFNGLRPEPVAAQPKREEPAPVAPIRHCPECGCNLEPYNRAKELIHG